MIFKIFLTLQPGSHSLSALVRAILSDKNPEEVPMVREYVSLCVSQLKFITTLLMKLDL